MISLCGQTVQQEEINSANHSRTRANARRQETRTHLSGNQIFACLPDFQEHFDLLVNAAVNTKPILHFTSCLLKVCVSETYERLEVQFHTFLNSIMDIISVMNFMTNAPDISILEEFGCTPELVPTR
jgi:hypothetical protein